MNHTAVLSRIKTWPVESIRQDPQKIVILCVALVITFLALSPTLMLLYGSIVSQPLGVTGEFTLRHYARAYADPQTYQLLANSFVFAAGAAMVSTVLATILAWISIRTNAPFRRFFELTAIIPNIFPPLMLAVSWVILLNPRDVSNSR
jgi:iron(III) transport system permease protein